MVDTLTHIVDRLAALAAAIRGAPHFEWGTVTAASPLAVRLDGDPEPLLGTPSKLVKGLRVNDRVFVALQNRRATIIGRASGPALPAPIERLRDTTDQISATAVSEFNMTAVGRPTFTTEHPVLCAITYKAWAGLASGNGLRIGISLSGATQLNWNMPAWGDVIRALQSGSVLVTKYVVLQPGTTELSVWGYRESTASVPAVSYQILQVAPIHYVERSSP